MEKKKTIGDLNSRAWYRLLKVFFGVVFIIVLGTFNFTAYSGGVRQIDQDRTTVRCNLGTQAPFTAQSIGGISLSGDDFPNGQFDYKTYFEGYNDYSIKDILKACFPAGDNSDIYAYQKEGEVLNKYGFRGYNALTQEQKNKVDVDMNAYDQQTKNIFGSDKAKYLDFSFKMFDITPVFTYGGFLELFFFGNLIILLVFEAIRICFYYIVLGSIRPEK